MLIASLRGLRSRRGIGPADGRKGRRPRAPRRPLLGVEVLEDRVALNQAPVAYGGAYALRHDTPLSAQLAASDPDGDPLTFVLLSGPAHGTLALQPGGAFFYTPGAGYVGPDAFTFRVSDGTADSTPAAITLNVINNPPVAQGAALGVGCSRSITALVFADDADGDLVTYSLVSGPGQGVLEFGADGAFTYTPRDGHMGPDAFTFRASDGLAFSNPAVVSLTTYSSDGCVLIAMTLGVLHATGDGGADLVELKVLPARDPNGGVVIVNGEAFSLAEITSMEVNLSGGDNYLELQTADGQAWTLTGVNAGTVGAPAGGSVIPITFASVQHLVGGAGADTFTFDDGARIDGTLDGGGGDNTLNYSAYTTAVTVNLVLGTATGTGGVSHIQHAIGGQGNDILVGDGAANLFRGGAGRDLLIGGPGSDTLRGEAGEDILIDGRTQHDASAAALASIRDYWARTDQTPAQRIAYLTTEAPYRLTTATVTSDEAANTLSGDAEVDWFFANALSTTDRDAERGEELVVLLTP